ncbi:bromodomain-containing protein 9 isoform X8 [Apus apus]|uniref:bromodomain-containing protein 9 isoform X8 n=1 Tax=Apus apus TaxID=8895 RepID=UPI0021F82710|nr:bromodomain-containing protein 9 isoform X8 [Apus apus]
MGKKHKKHKAEKAEWRSASTTAYSDYVDKPLEKPLKLVLKVGGSEVTELSGSGHDSSYYDDRSDHERERHKEKKKKKKKKSEKVKEKHLDDEERRKRKEEKKRKREKEQCDTEGETDDFDPGKKVEVEPPSDRPVRACRTQPAENESTPIQQLLEHFLRQLQRKDPHGFFAVPVTDSIAPGYSMIIKHPMDFGTMKDKIAANQYKSVTEFKADFKLMCDNAMTYNRPDTVYYKLAKKILHTGFKMMSKERLLALKRSMSFMQDMDFSQQAALLGDEDTAVEEPVPEVVPVQAETTKKSKKQSKEVIREKFLAKQMEEDTSGERNGFGVRRSSTQYLSCIFEPEGNACSLTDSTAEEHVLALVEHAADEARDRINRYLPNSKIGYLKKNGDGTLLFSVVNSSDPEAEEEEAHPVDLSSLSSKLLPGFTTLGFKDERKNKVTFLTSASTAPSIQNNSIFHDLKSDEMELLYSAYGDETGIQCALRALSHGTRPSRSLKRSESALLKSSECRIVNVLLTHSDTLRVLNYTFLGSLQPRLPSSFMLSTSLSMLARTRSTTTCLLTGSSTTWKKKLSSLHSRNHLDCWCLVVLPLQQMLEWLKSPMRTRACDHQAAPVYL